MRFPIFRRRSGAPRNGRLRQSALLALAILTLSCATAQPQGLDIGGWQIKQYNSGQTYTIPAGTVIQPGSYFILSRFATKAAFETFYGVTLGSNVIYETNPIDNPVVPMINGDEVYEVYDAGSALIDGPTPAITTLYQAYHRDDPEAAPWTAINGTPTPGSGVEAPDAIYSGLVISEVNDASGGGAFVYEYVELYYDGDAGGPNLPPVISNTQSQPVTPSGGDTLTVTTTVTDSDGTVVEVLCYWRYSDESFSPVTMTGAGDDYECTIPDLQADRLLQYYIYALDDGGATATDPAGAPGNAHAVWIQGDLPGGKVVLFDHAHDQDAGTDGNWRVDDDFPYPLPAVPSAESDWSGQLSTWAYELYNAGNTIRSNTTALNASLLSDVNLLVIVEPQNPFTAAEISAVGEFVYGGGSLFVVANHNGSDRNGNGWDSASIFGGYTVPHISDPVGADTETFCGALFGLHFHVKDEGNNGITGTFSNVDSDPLNPIINGPSGAVAAVIYHVGNVMSLWPLANPYLSEVAGHIWKDGDTGNPDVNIAAWSRYGNGKVLGYGDSSSCADGTDSEPHENDWAEPGSNNREFFLNASWWLLDNDLTAVGDDRRHDMPGLGLDLSVYPNPFNPQASIRFILPGDGRADVEVYDLRGQLVRTILRGMLAAGPHEVIWDGRDDLGRPLPSGAYLVRTAAAGTVAYRKVMLAK